MSPLPAATNGRPPKISGFQSGRWPLRLNHSALHAWNGRPAGDWSLPRVAGHIPPEIGRDSNTGHKGEAGGGGGGGGGRVVGGGGGGAGGGGPRGSTWRGPGG